MGKKIITFLVSAYTTLLALPLVALADFPALPDGKEIDVVDMFDKIFNFIWPLFLLVAVLMFIVAAFMFVISSGDASKVKVARTAVLWGVVGIVVAIISFSIPLIVSQVLGV